MRGVAQALCVVCTVRPVLACMQLATVRLLGRAALLRRRTQMVLEVRATLAGRVSLMGWRRKHGLMLLTISVQYRMLCSLTGIILRRCRRCARALARVVCGHLLATALRDGTWLVVLECWRMRSG